MMHEIKSICVYCASSAQIDQCYFDEARRLGQILAEQGIRLINGAGRFGLMRATTDGCLERGGQAVGVIPTFMIQEGWVHPGMTEIVETTDMHIRQQKMADMSDAAIILPGGCGTLAELTELIIWKQLGLYLKPIIILNVEGYYDPFLQMMKQAADKNFLRTMHTGIWRVARTAQEAVDLALSTPLWDEEVRKLASI
uniref:Cytokinin riboside 5'-monophosphate phosphoribohydrolase n=1 Tax=uncultured bacterium fosmid pJB135F11 TaxID=1478051 RepID=A0A0H3U8M6_9BACT|nr:hypothetical protein [uncultured bacterium fosmid pJB135F11]